MLTVILKKINFSELFNLRRVNNRWKGVIEALFNTKRSLLLTNESYLSFLILNYSRIDSFNSLWLDRKNFNRFQLMFYPNHQRGPNFNFSMEEFKLSSDFCSLLQKLFPNLESLAIDINVSGKYLNLDNLLTLLEPWSFQLKTFILNVNILTSQAKILWDFINSMPLLRQLVIRDAFYTDKDDSIQSLVPTFGRLNRSLLRIRSFEILSALVSKFGPNCTHLWIKSNYAMSTFQMRQCYYANRELWSNLTHLRMVSLENVQVLQVLCQHVPSLQVLDVGFDWGVS